MTRTSLSCSSPSFFFLSLSKSSGFVVAVVDDSASQDALRQAEANLVQTKAAQTNAAVTLERVRQLVARGIAAKQELDDSLARELADQLTGHFRRNGRYGGELGQGGGSGQVGGGELGGRLADV